MNLCFQLEQDFVVSQPFIEGVPSPPISLKKFPPLDSTESALIHPDPHWEDHSHLHVEATERACVKKCHMVQQTLFLDIHKERGAIIFISKHRICCSSSFFFFFGKARTELKCQTNELFSTGQAFGQQPQRSELIQDKDCKMKTSGKCDGYFCFGEFYLCVWFVQLFFFFRKRQRERERVHKRGEKQTPC